MNIKYHKNDCAENYFDFCKDGDTNKYKLLTKILYK